MEELGMVQPSFDDNGHMHIVVHSPEEDELNRAFLRAESRDPHDSTYFVHAGDKWNAVTAGALGTGDGSTTRFYFGGQTTDLAYPAMTPAEAGNHKEVRNVTIYFDDVEQADGYSVDVSSFPDGNAAEHFARGYVDFEAAPGADVVITADYEWCDIGGGDTKLVYDQAVDGDSKSFDVVFSDPVHIKDGVIYFTGGALDATVNVMCICPAGMPYKDDNGDVCIATAERLIAHYVVDHVLLGDAEMGHYFDVEARSTAMPAGYIVRATIDAGSATALKAIFRIEINRERTHVK